MKVETKVRNEIAPSPVCAPAAATPAAPQQKRVPFPRVLCNVTNEEGVVLTLETNRAFARWLQAAERQRRPRPPHVWRLFRTFPPFRYKPQFRPDVHGAPAVRLGARPPRQQAQSAKTGCETRASLASNCRCELTRELAPFAGAACLHGLPLWRQPPGGALVNGPDTSTELRLFSASNPIGQCYEGSERACSPWLCHSTPQAQPSPCPNPTQFPT